MSMRDKIAAIVPKDAQEGISSESTADAILAEIVASVPPLVWDGFCSGPYMIDVEKGGIANLYFYGNAAEHEEDGPELLCGAYLTLKSIDDSKAAAQAHHVAQKTDWMMG